MTDTLEKIVLALVSLFAASSSILSVVIQWKRNSDDKSKTDADAAKVINEASLDIVSQYKKLAEEASANANLWKQELAEIKKEIDGLVQMNRSLGIQNDELIRENAELRQEVRELRAVVKILSTQIKELGVLPNFGNRASDCDLIEKGLEL